MHRIRGLALLLALLLLTGCTRTAPSAQEPEPDSAAIVEEPSADPSEDSEQARPQDLTLAYAQGDSFNPYRAKTSVNRQLLGLLYEGLFAVSPDGTAQPRLCERFEVSADLRTYTLYLRSGVQLHNGTALSPQDVIASLQAARRDGYYAYRLRHIRSVVSVQSGAVSIELDTPYEDLPLILDVPIVRARDVDADSPLGTGPYKRSGKRLLRFDSYWMGADAVDLGSRVRLREASSADEICAAFTDGRILLACVDPNGETGPIYHCASDLYACDTMQMQYLGFNTESGLFRSETLRAAITYLIDRETLVAEFCSSFADPTVLPCPSTSPHYDRSLALRYSYDPEKYWTMLNDAEIHDSDADGVLDYFPGEKDLDARGTLLVCAGHPERLQMARRIASTLQDYGIELNIRALNSADYRRALLQGSYDLFLGETALSPDGDLSAFFDPRSELCLRGMNREDLLLKCELALENGGNYYTLYEAILKEGLFYPLLFKQYAVYVQSGSGVSLSPALGNLYYTPWEDPA